MPDGYLYEVVGGICYGYFSGKYLYSMNGTCVYYRGGSEQKYLYTINEGQCDYYQSDKYFYSINEGVCRWYTS
jgi:hypothetical protein